MTYQIEMFDPPAPSDPTNEDRAAMVRPLVQVFREAYYYGPEALGTVVQDMVTDLMHLFDQLAGEDVGPLSAVTAQQMIEWAVGNYVAEVAEEMDEEESSE